MKSTRHAYHLMCNQPHCPRLGTVWTVPCKEIQPGLIRNDTLHYRCTGCDCTPAVVALVDARDPVITKVH